MSLTASPKRGSGANRIDHHFSRNTTTQRGSKKTDFKGLEKILIIIIALNVDLRQPFSRPGVLSRLWCQIWWGAANPADDTFPFCSSTALPKSLPPLPTLFQRRPSVTGDKQPALGCRSGREPHLVKTQDLTARVNWLHIICATYHWYGEL